MQSPVEGLPVLIGVGEEPTAVRRPAKEDKLLDTDWPICFRGLGDEGDLAHERSSTQPPDVLSVESHDPLTGPQKPGQRPQGRALAGTVRSEQRREGTRLRHQVEVPQDDPLSIAASDAAGGEARHYGSSPGTSDRRRSR